MAIGVSDLKNVLRLPSTWDASYLQQFALKDGTTIDQVVRRIGTALAVFNASLSQGYWANYIATTISPTVDDEIGGEGGAELPTLSEFDNPDPVRGATTGHMLPMKDYGGSLQWTHLALRRALRGKIDADVRRLIERSGNTWEKRVMERLFKSAADTVGNTGVSAPFADAGVADASYIPPSNGGRSFASSHTHFLRLTDDSTGRIAAVQQMAFHLYEHGIMSPWELVVPEVDRTDWTALTDTNAKFVKPQRDAFLTAGVELRGVTPEETYIGLIETDLGFFRVKTSPRLPTNYAGAFKPTGYGSPSTTLAVRYEEGYPLGLSLVAQPTAFPLEGAVAYFTFGVGVNNRVGGVCTFFAASGAYVDPAIS